MIGHSAVGEREERHYRKGSGRCAEARPWGLASCAATPLVQGAECGACLPRL